MMHTGVAMSLTASVTDAGADCPAVPRRSFSLTARNVSRESAAASRAELDPMRVLDAAHVREGAFSDVSRKSPLGLAALASSWAALLVHAWHSSSPRGRLAMVLPAELLTVGYAEPIRSWLGTRFAATSRRDPQRGEPAGGSLPGGRTCGARV
jgi:hypothetical protein